jgi:intracellular sulfur oxidation DsrE/DsrF family protein
LIARNFVILAIVAALFWLAVGRLGQNQQPVASVQQANPSAEPGQRLPNRVGDVSVHSVEELDLLFSRVEQLLDRPRREGEAPLISLVLHGPEVEFFALKNYDKYRSVVDRAAKLAALGAVDISICQTRMREYGIGPEEVPSFLNQVPFGPAEIERLVDQGFVYM